jgi:hypothetical protein
MQKSINPIRKKSFDRTVWETAPFGPAKEKPKCKGSNSQESFTSKFRNSLYNLKLKNKLSYEFDLDLAKENEPFIYKICKNYTGIKNFKSIADAIEQLKKVVSNDNLEVVLDKENEVICFVEELSVEQFWHHYPIRNIVEELEEDNANLKTFLQVIRLLDLKGFSTWYGGDLYGYEVFLEDKYYLQEYLDQLLEEDKIDGYKDTLELIKEYKTGKIHKWKKEIIRSNKIEKELLIRKIKSFPLALLKEWMLNTIELFYDSYNIANYETSYMAYNDEGLKLSNTYSIVWDDKDFVFDKACEFIDDEANNCGYEVATLVYQLTDKNKVDFSDYVERKEFLNKVSKNWRQYIKMYESINQQIVK